MKYNRLGNSDLNVSEICLGSMTWGTQNNEAEAHAQIDYALEQGVNFIDTAEMYPVNPISAETQGSTEQIIGNWIKKSGMRDKIVLATKVTGEGLKWVQDGILISPLKIRTSIEGSLKRLQTDYIDLYQLHWPNRGSLHFRQNWRFDPTSQNREQTREHIFETLKALGELIEEGKIRSIGLSNESCWGTSQFLQIAEVNGLPRVATIQNEYSLMYRHHDLDLAELSHNEQVGLLPFSPLACGMLTGKYQNGARPAGSRITINADLHGRVNDVSWMVVDKYVALALEHGLDPTQMAIAFCNQRPFVDSSIVGASSVEQLHVSLAAKDLKLSAEVLEGIQQIYRQHPMPF
ncbi:MAG: aryl-alcohol dehydrogenase-like predicted oxidoreductase [Planctomycetota bacterium]|jgi:aryl-alcohol dehydrogenase-like predicted oxidoreductase